MRWYTMRSACTAQSWGKHMQNTPPRVLVGLVSHTTTCLHVRGTPSPVSSPIIPIFITSLLLLLPLLLLLIIISLITWFRNLSIANLPALEFCLHKLEGFNGRKQIQNTSRKLKSWYCHPGFADSQSSGPAKKLNESRFRWNSNW